MGTKQKRLFFWAGVIAGITAIAGLTVFAVFNWIVPDRYGDFLIFLQEEVGMESKNGSFRSYINMELLTMGLVNGFLAWRYITYSKMSIRQLTSRSGGMLLVLLINAFCGGSVVSLIVAFIGMIKPITPDFNEKTIKEIDREMLDRNPNTVSRIIKIKQDKLNGVITEEEYMEKLNQILDDEARRFL